MTAPDHSNNSSNSNNSNQPENTDEFYYSEGLRILTETCKEKDKKIHYMTKIINYSVSINILLLYLIIHILYSNYSQ